MDLRNILFRRASRICFSLSDHVSASLGASDFDTTSSVDGGTFKSNISLVDPTVQFSGLRNDWSSGVCLSPSTQSKIRLYIHLLGNNTGAGITHGIGVRDVQGMGAGHCLGSRLLPSIPAL